jgi:PIN domain nuclease of toxin-antitoxin system
VKLLLDTHVLLWAASGWVSQTDGLSERAIELLTDTGNQLHFSAASLWEISIKNGLGRADFRVDASLLRRGLLDNGYLPLPITDAHAIAISSLPDLHKDPFDRILIAQAVVEGIHLLTTDVQVAAYPGPILRV